MPKVDGSLGNSSLGDESPLFADLSPLALGESSPDAELLALVNGELETLGLNLAFTADGFRLSGGGAALGEEKVGVCAPAIGVVLPGQLVECERFDELAVHEVFPYSHSCNYIGVILTHGARAVNPDRPFKVHQRSVE